MSKYAPLMSYFKSIPTEQDTISLFFKDIETILDFELPSTAKCNRTWWGNSAKKINAGQWMSAGWKVVTVDIPGKFVEFKRIRKENPWDFLFEKDIKDPLKDYLFWKSPESDEVTLAFEDIEEIRKQPLPPSAKSDPSWWVNDIRINKYAKIWLAAGWEVSKVSIDSQTVTFITQPDNGNGNQIRNGNYLVLADFLRQVPQQQDQIALNLQEICSVLGRKLPKTAYINRTWWGNSAGSHKFWVSAGWKVESAHLKSEIIVFRRKEKNYFKAITKYIKELLGDSSHLAQIDSHTLVKWISFCRRAGWYFQATALYEKGGINFDALSNDERVLIDDEYEISKRELMRYKNKGV